MNPTVHPSFTTKTKYMTEVYRIVIAKAYEFIDYYLQQVMGARSLRMYILTYNFTFYFIIIVSLSSSFSTISWVQTESFGSSDLYSRSRARSRLLVRSFAQQTGTRQRLMKREQKEKKENPYVDTQKMRWLPDWGVNSLAREDDEPNETVIRPELNARWLITMRTRLMILNE